MVVTVQGSAVDVEGHESLGTSRRPVTRRTALIAGAVAVLLAAAGGGRWYAVWNDDQNEQLATASQAWESALAAERKAIEDGTAVLDASEGKVADDEVRQDLLTLVQQSVPAAPEASDTSRSDLTAAYTDLTAEAAAATAEIKAATEAVTTAQATWELQQAQAGYDGALAQLTAGLDAASATLAGSEGKVLDDTTRQGLTASVEAGVALRDAAPASEVDALVSATGGLTASIAALEAATSAVVASQTAWQTEQDRVAAEQAAASAAAQAAQRAAAQTSGSSAGSTAKNGTTSKGPAVKSGGGASATTPRVTSPSGSNFGTGTAPPCTTPSCGITF